MVIHHAVAINMEDIFEERFNVCRWNRYDIQRKIGEGAFGEVRLGIDTQVCVVNVVHLKEKDRCYKQVFC